MISSINPKSPGELIEYLSFYVSGEYDNFKLQNCEWDERAATLHVNMLTRAAGLSHLYGRLENDFTKMINREVTDEMKSSITVTYAYSVPYIDAQILSLDVAKFIRANYPTVAMTMTDDDLHITESVGGYVINLAIAPQMQSYFRGHKAQIGFIQNLCDNHFYSFEFNLTDKHVDMHDDENAIAEFDKFLASQADSEVFVDKWMNVKTPEYFLGIPINRKPVKIKYIKKGDGQVIAGNINFIKPREFIRKTPEGTEELRQYYSFVIDDGEERMSCVFFPNKKSKPLFDKLVDGTFIAAIGNYSEQNGRTSMRVAGISLSDLKI